MVKAEEIVLQTDHGLCHSIGNVCEQSRGATTIMVQLNRITTKTGDDGTTGLGNGSRVSKTHPRIVAMGSVDELNAALGMVLAAQTVPVSLVTPLRQVQNDLFDAGAELCLPSNVDTAQVERLGITAVSVERLEQWTEEANQELQPLNSFILPGGTPLAATLHLARTVCRRAERDVLVLAESEPVGQPVRQYLNRLSDLLFVWARMANNGGSDDILWRPGGAMDL